MRDKQFIVKGFCINVGWGVWDSWGFGLSFWPYTKSFNIEFIHWYAYVEFWKSNEQVAG